MTFLQHLRVEDNKTTGWNDAPGFKSTLNANLDLYSRAGTMRFASDEDIVRYFNSAFKEDATLAMKNLFYIRDVKQGMGERNFFDVVIKHLATHETDIFKKVVKLIPFYGSWADVRKIIGSEDLTDEQVMPTVKLMHKALVEDLARLDSGEPITLVAKWAPSVGSKNKVHKLALRRLLSFTGMKEKVYRKMISRMREQLSLVEHKLTEKKTDKIDYSQVPSQAFKKYTKAFFRNDGERFEEFLNRANEGEVKVNAGTLHTHQLVTEYFGSIWNNFMGENKAIEAQWKNLPKPQANSLNVLPMVDVSGSMSGLPMEVAVSIGIFLSENSEGEFRNNFLTFSSEPELITMVEGDSLFNKVRQVIKSDWGMNTDLEAALQMILNTAVKNNLKQEELPDLIPILTDMQMDNTGRFGAMTDMSFYQKMKQKFEDNSYQIPTLLWWNIAGDYSGALAVTKDEQNTILISGFSQKLFDNILNLDLDKLEDYTPETAMLEVLNGERYERVGHAIHLTF